MLEKGIRKLRDLRPTERNVALILTLASFFTGSVFLGTFSYRMIQAIPALDRETDPKALNERELLVRRRLSLIARINLCEQEIAGRVPEARSVCPESERSRISEYRTQVLEIDEKLLRPE